MTTEDRALVEETNKVWRNLTDISVVPPKIEFLPIHEKAILPTRGSSKSVGLDLYSVEYHELYGPSWSSIRHEEFMPVVTPIVEPSNLSARAYTNDWKRLNKQPRLFDFR